jgi:hypothetical protein
MEFVSAISNFILPELWRHFSFSALFAGDIETGHRPAANARYRRGPDSDPLSRRSNAASSNQPGGAKPKGPAGKIDLIGSDMSSEKRAAERREQYKLVRAHVARDEAGRTQAYGWSIPVAGGAREPPAASAIVPVPVHIRPLIHQDLNLKVSGAPTHTHTHILQLWCGTGLILSGGRTADGGYIVGAGGSVFYGDAADASAGVTKDVTPTDSVESLNVELMVCMWWCRCLWLWW